MLGMKQRNLETQVFDELPAFFEVPVVFPMIQSICPHIFEDSSQTILFGSSERKVRDCLTHT